MGKNNGFTLPELMVVVAIISLLASISMPKFSNLIDKAREASSKGNLATLRTAINIYYADNEGDYPEWLQVADVLTAGGKYINQIPALRLPARLGHTPSAFFYSGVAPPGHNVDSGQWLFSEPYTWINCTHVDTVPRVWSTW